MTSSLGSATSLGNANTITTTSVNLTPSSIQSQRDGSLFFHEDHMTSCCSSMRGLKPGNANWINQDNFFIIESKSNTSNGTLSQGRCTI